MVVVTIDAVSPLQIALRKMAVANQTALPRLPVAPELAQTDKLLGVVIAMAVAITMAHGVPLDELLDELCWRQLDLNLLARKVLNEDRYDKLLHGTIRMADLMFTDDEERAFFEGEGLTVTVIDSVNPDIIQRHVRVGGRSPAEELHGALKPSMIDAAARPRGRRLPDLRFPLLRRHRSK